jgi:hypothetical protein
MAMNNTIAPDEIDLEAFLRSWYGVPDRPATPVGPEYDWVPEALRCWYALSSKWSASLMSTKRFLSLANLDREGDKYIFLGDQGDWAWSFDPAEPNAVYEAKGDAPWRLIAEGFAEFLLHNAVSEAIESSSVVQWSLDIADIALRAALSKFSLIDFKESSWPAPDSRLYMNSEAIALVRPKRQFREPKSIIDGHYALTVGAKNQQAIAHLSSIGQVEWRSR